MPSAAITAVLTARAHHFQLTLQWVPWFTLDGVDVVQDADNSNSKASFRGLFLLGKKICDLYVEKTGVPKAISAFYSFVGHTLTYTSARARSHHASSIADVWTASL